MVRFVALALVLIALNGCSNDASETDEQRACITREFPRYNPAKFEDCVSACQSCQRGVTATCATSCRLKGAK